MMTKPVSSTGRSPHLKGNICMNVCMCANAHTHARLFVMLNNIAA